MANRLRSRRRPFTDPHAGKSLPPKPETMMPAVSAARAARAARARPVPRDEFSRRRQHLMKLMGKDSIAVISAAPVRLRNSDVEYAYRQDSDFYYLTGFGEPESVAVLIPGREQGEYLMFVRDRDPARESWDGRRAGPAGAVRAHGADDAFPITDMDEILPGLLLQDFDPLFAVVAPVACRHRFLLHGLQACWR